MLRAALRRLPSVASVVAAESALVGLAVGAGEAVRIAATRGVGVADLPALYLLVVGLTLLGAFLAAPLLMLLLRGLAEIHFLAAWWGHLRAPGETRVAALVRALLIAAGAAVFASLTYAIGRWARETFNAPGAIALLEAALQTAAALVVIALVAIAARHAAPRAGRYPFAVRATSGRGGLIVGLVVIVVAVALVVVRAAPSADFRPYVTALLFVVTVVVARAMSAGRRLGPRGRLGAIVGGVLLLVSALGASGSADRARGLVAADGIASRRVLASLWSLTDRDGDGFASSFGGADCDDDSAAISPKAREIIGNRRDDNCTGGDLTLDAVAARATVQPTAFPATGRRPNVILLSIDAFRADHAQSYGYARKTTPNLAALAARATRFEWAVSPSPTTRRAVPALMSGRYASALSWQQGDKVRVKLRAHEMLGRTFANAGYETFAIHCCTTLFDRPHGVVDGIRKVDASAEKLHNGTKNNSYEVGRRVVAFLRAREAQRTPFFLWSHMIDPHDPYSHIPGAPTFGTEPVDKYDSELAFVDQQVGSILAALRETGLEGETIIVVTADHGEEFLEHGNRFHGRSVYNEVMRVPLVVFAPDGAPSVVKTPVSLVDVGPTVLDLAGLDRPAGQNGRSLAAAVRGVGPAPERTVLGELIQDFRIDRNLVAAYRGDWKLIWDLDANSYELFSLSQDPLDRTDRMVREPAAFEEMKQNLHEAMDRELAVLPDDPEP